MLNSKVDSELLALIKRCKRYERSAQFELYRKFYGFGMAICLRYSHTQEEALEMLNDAFFQIFTKIHQYNEQYTFVAWAKSIFIHASISYLRKYDVPAVVSDEQQINESPATEDVSLWINQEEATFFVSQLSPQYRAVFNLYEIEGYSHDEIALMLGISAGTSKSNLFRARIKLEQIVREYFKKNIIKTSSHDT